MSTKIYDGILINVKSIYELNQLIKQIRNKLIPIAQKEYFKILANMICQAYAYKKYTAFIDGPISDYSSLTDAEYNDLAYKTSKIARNIIRQNKVCDNIMEYTSDLDLEVSMSVFPLEDGRFLGIPFVQNGLLFEKLLETPEFIEYGYWNNTDKLDSVSDEEWEAREKDWDLALTGVGRPIDDGFQYKIIDMESHLFLTVFHAKNLEDYLVDNNSLKMAIAKSMLRDKKFDDFKSEFSDSQIVRHMFKVNEYIKTHPEELEEISHTLDADIKEILV